MGQTTAAASGPHHTFPQIAPQYYIAQILDMFAAGDIVLVQLICMMEITRKTLPTLSWEQLRIASRASIHQRILANAASLSLRLLHATSRPRSESPDEVHFLSW